MASTNNDEFESKLLFYSQLVTGFLLVLSEFLGMSKCEYNGILHFIFNVFQRKIYVDVRLDQEDVVAIGSSTSSSSSSSSSSFHTALDEIVVCTRV
jgi:hypothetical protein